tara:strand:+ start:2123 stop:2359 length:237 start_codon:yes stop_codon:yes gene_type:complete
MKNKTFIFLIFFSFLSFYIFNSEKCVKIQRFYLIDNMNNVLKYSINYYYDIKIIPPNKYEHVYALRKESIKLFFKCTL